MKECIHCKAKVKEVDLFCGECGKQIDSGKEKTEPRQPKKFKWQYILLLILGIGVGIFGNYLLTNKTEEKSTLATEEEAKPVIEEQGNKSLLKTEGKEEVAVSKLQAEAVTIFTGTTDDLSYEIYMHQENVKEKEDTEGGYAKYGDILETSEIVFYVAEKDADVAYRQEQLEPFVFMRNLTNLSSDTKNWYAELEFPDYTLIGLYEYLDIFAYRTIHMFDLVDGELQQVNTENMRYSYYYPLIKTVNDDKIQVVLLEESSEFKWFFETYAYDRNTVTMNFYNDKTYDKYDFYDSLLADIIFDQWEAHEDAYVPFTKEEDKKTWDLEMILKDAKNGGIEDVPFKIGDSMIDVYNKNKAFDYLVASHSIGPTMEVSYDNFVVGYKPMKEDVAYFEGELEVDFRGTVNLLKIPETYTTFSMTDVNKSLGEPDEFIDADGTYDEKNFYGYYIDEYTLIFAEDIYDNNVEVILLMGDLESYIATGLKSL